MQPDLSDEGRLEVEQGFHRESSLACRHGASFPVCFPRLNSPPSRPLRLASTLLHCRRSALTSTSPPSPPPCNTSTTVSRLYRCWGCGRQHLPPHSAPCIRSASLPPFYSAIHPHRCPLFLDADQRRSDPRGVHARHGTVVDISVHLHQARLPSSEYLVEAVHDLR
ncbi:hypothetical protein SORBI_3010G246900 [Sorghum bicolor]|uniref:Uncharacterized protein n=1 Tax=Sorghum bicolor TaxID=4558 RepID=A0A1W0VUN2_SORBI|nr:hypothetical protein SORBI_3010G246900 [Sorghum bicolor]OQU76983.1 hypothetical protein SORBI_3010G246900 [Sorghum bicolor]OQU76984.1 hypothetical protein SORBI_3010G246900 [Sorghum bicolor]